MRPSPTGMARALGARFPARPVSPLAAAPPRRTIGAAAVGSLPLWPEWPQKRDASPSAPDWQLLVNPKGEPGEQASRCTQ